MLAEQTPARYVAFDLLALDDESLLEQPLRGAAAGARARRSATPSTLTPLTREPEARRAVAAGRRGRRRQGPGSARTGPASGPGWSRSSGCARSTRWSSASGRARRTDTVGSLILGLYDDGGRAPRRRALLGTASRPRSARWWQRLAPYETGHARSRRPEPVEEREGARVDRAAARAGRRGHLRPRQRRPHPPRHEDPALARGQGADGTASSSRCRCSRADPP